MSNPDLSIIAEQLCRIEHKLDLVVTFLAETHPDFVLRPVGDPAHIDPTTLEAVTYFIDFMRNHVARKTLGGTGMLPNASTFNINIPGSNNGSPGSDGTPPR